MRKAFAIRIESIGKLDNNIYCFDFKKCINELIKINLVY